MARSARDIWSRTTCYNRLFVGRAGVWDQIVEAPAAGHNATVQMSKPFSPTWCTEPMSSIVVLRSAMITVRLGLGRLRRVA
jgi:hypothetical protein